MHWEHRKERTTLCMRIKKRFIKKATLGKRHKELAEHLPVGKTEGGHSGWGGKDAGKSEVVRKGSDVFGDHSLSQEGERQQLGLKMSSRGDRQEG